MGDDSLKTLSSFRCFGGTQGFYEHSSSACAGPMRFGVYTPPQADEGEVPVVYFLAGLTCTEETFAMKAGAQRIAAELGLILITPDTSPRQTRLPGDDLSWDYGLGAGFYVDASEAPWASAYNMYSYVTRELPALVEAHFPAKAGARGVMGHSMGGHGALVCALRAPESYQSVSAFAPISTPSEVPWGQKAFAGYLGEDRAAWARYDATRLVAHSAFPGEILIDQGLSDKFLERELRPELFEAAAAEAGQALRLRRHEGYDHSYYFIATFIEEHLRHHAKALLG